MNYNSVEFRCALLVSAIAFVSYLNTLNAGFAYDDNRAIIENADVKTSSSWQNLWYNDFWGTPISHSGSHKSYRPICTLSFRLNYLLHGLEPRGYHLINVLLHCLVCGLLTIFAFKLCRDHFSSFAASLLFAVHPVHTEAVAGVVGRADEGAAFFFLLCLIFYQKSIRADEIQHNGKTNVGFFLLSNICYIASTLTKEIGITAIGVCIIYDIVFITRPNCSKLDHFLQEAIRKGTIVRVLCMFAVAAVLIYTRLYIMDFSTPVFAVADNPASNHPDRMVRLLTFLYLPVVNCCLLIFPWQLSFDWSMDSIPLVTSLDDHRNVYSLILYSILIFMTCQFLKIYLSGLDKLNLQTLLIEKGNSEKQTTEKKEQFLKMNIDCNFSSNVVNGEFLCQPADKPNCLRYRLYNDLSKGAPYSTNGLVQNHCLQKITNSFMRKDFSCMHKKDYQTHSTLTNEKKQRNREMLQNVNCRSNAGKEMYKLVTDEVHDPLTYDNWHQMRYQHAAAIMSLSIILVPFIPASNLLMYVGFVVAERILYIPSIGFCLLVGLGLRRLLIIYQSKQVQVAIKICFFTIVGLFSMRTVLRNKEWQDEESLYKSGLVVNPPKAWGNLGNVLSGQGRISEAEAAYRNAIKYRQNMADTHYNLGLLLQNSKRYKESVECYKRAIYYRPNLASAYLNLGSVYDAIGHKQEAVQVLKSAINISDVGLKNPKAHQYALTSIKFNLGKIMLDLKRYKESVHMLHEAIKTMPEAYPSYSIYNMLGQAYSYLQDRDTAERWYIKSLHVNHSHIPAQLAYAKHLASMGNSIAADDWFLKAINSQPNNSDSHFHYAQFLFSVGRTQDGYMATEKSIELNPNETGLLSFAASSYREHKDYIKAEYYYKRVLLLKPHEPSSHMNLGALYHLIGRLDEAEVEYHEAFMLNPEDKILLTNIQKLQSLKRRTKHIS